MKVRIIDHELYDQTRLPRRLIGTEGKVNRALDRDGKWGIEALNSTKTYQLPAGYLVPDIMLEFLEA